MTKCKNDIHTYIIPHKICVFCIKQFTTYFTELSRTFDKFSFTPENVTNDIFSINSKSQTDDDDHKCISIPINFQYTLSFIKQLRSVLT